jgi:hypothetical protein
MAGVEAVGGKSGVRSEERGGKRGGSGWGERLRLTTDEGRVAFEVMKPRFFGDGDAWGEEGGLVGQRFWCGSWCEGMGSEIGGGCGCGGGGRWRDRMSGGIEVVVGDAPVWYGDAPLERTGGCGAGMELRGWRAGMWRWSDR